jgi:hypothetical protein
MIKARFAMKQLAVLAFLMAFSAIHAGTARICFTPTFAFRLKIVSAPFLSSKKITAF